MITLYYSPQSCSLIPHIFLKEVEADYKIELIHIREEMHKKPKFLAINPKGKLPVIEHKGKIITETLAIMSYIANLHPETPLLSKDLLEKTNVWEWASFFNSSLHTAFLRYYRPNYFITDKEHYQKVQNLADQDIANIFAKIDSILANSSFLMGENFQLCDIFLFNYGRWGNLASKPTKEYPNFAKFMEKVSKRNAVFSVLKEEKIQLYRDLMPIIS